MRRAAQAATIGFAALAAFQAALAAGAPLGDAAWGGAHAQLTTEQRVGSAVAVVFYILAVVVVRRRGAGRPERRYRWGTWALVVVLGISALMNVASDSRWENHLLAPVALVLAGLCAIVAHAANAPAARESGNRPTGRHARPLAGEAGGRAAAATRVGVRGGRERRSGI